MRTPLLKDFILVIALTSLATTASVADAGHGRIAVSAQADVRVWVEGGDVFDSYSDVAIWLRPERDCYTTLFMVDTDGYMHVLYPSSAYDDTWLYGGRSYCYRASDLGLDRLDGAGIAYVFAVGSPAPFDYSTYGAGVFVGGFGFRVYGDPFVACRDFYLTLLPSACRYDYVGVSYARFYVRRWERYPSYLCYAGPGIHVRVGDGCRSCNGAYVSYRTSCARASDVFRPVPRFKQVYAAGQDGYGARVDVRQGRVERVNRASFKEERTASTREYTAKQVVKPSVRSKEASVAKKSMVRTSVRTSNRSFERARVVSTSSARERTTVDGADVQAMKKQSTQAVRTSRPSDALNRNTVTKQNAQAQTAREKGTKKKIRQAR